MSAPEHHLSETPQSPVAGASQEVRPSRLRLLLRWPRVLAWRAASRLHSALSTRPQPGCLSGSSCGAGERPACRGASLRTGPGLAGTPGQCTSYTRLASSWKQRCSSSGSLRGHMVGMAGPSLLWFQLYWHGPHSHALSFAVTHKISSHSAVGAVLGPSNQRASRGLSMLPALWPPPSAWEDPPAPSRVRLLPSVPVDLSSPPETHIHYPRGSSDQRPFVVCGM